MWLSCVFTSSLARGQEYYTGNVFEVYDKELIEKIKLQEDSSDTKQIHPVFLNEETKEISLLDGIENSILED